MILAKASRIRIVFITLVVFATALFLDDWLDTIAVYRALPRLIRRLEQPVLALGLCLIAIWWVHGFSLLGGLRELGLGGRIAPAIGFGFLATSPMWVTGILLDRPIASTSSVQLLFLAAIWPFGEEVLFRGYAFGQLFRRAHLNMWLAAIVTGLTFGAVHLANASVQRMPWSDQVGTVLLIGVGGILFAWAYARWDCNLWIPWSLHAFMNLWWEVFALSDTPLGGWGANAMRLGVVLVAIGLTLWRTSAPRVLEERTAAQ